MKIRLDQVIDAIETADDAYTYFYDTQSKETIFLADPMYTGERDEALAELIENSSGRFLRFPSKYDIHEYSIMQSFIDDMPDGAARRELASAIRGKGAFRRFKNGIRYHRIAEAWYSYQASSYREIAIRWCRDNDLEYEE